MSWALALAASWGVSVLLPLTSLHLSCIIQYTCRMSKSSGGKQRWKIWRSVLLRARIAVTSLHTNPKAHDRARAGGGRLAQEWEACWGPSLQMSYYGCLHCQSLNTTPGDYNPSCNTFIFLSSYLMRLFSFLKQQLLITFSISNSLFLFLFICRVLRPKD